MNNEQMKDIVSAWIIKESRGLRSCSCSDLEEMLEVGLAYTELLMSDVGLNKKLKTDIISTIRKIKNKIIDSFTYKVEDGIQYIYNKETNKVTLSDTASFLLFASRTNHINKMLGRKLPLAFAEGIALLQQEDGTFNKEFDISKNKFINDHYSIEHISKAIIALSEYSYFCNDYKKFKVAMKGIDYLFFSSRGYDKITDNWLLGIAASIVKQDIFYDEFREIEELCQQVAVSINTPQDLYNVLWFQSSLVETSYKNHMNRLIKSKTLEILNSKEDNLKNKAIQLQAVIKYHNFTH